MRIDVTYYVAYVSLRPDNATWLISYPYYVKYTVPGSRTFFRHLDYNPGKMVYEQRGAAMI